MTKPIAPRYASNIRDRVGADCSWEPAEQLLVDARRSALWREPLRTIFRSPHWQPGS